MESRSIFEVLYHIHVEIQRIHLGQVSNFPSDFERTIRDRATVDFHCPGARRHVAGDDLHRRGLAGSVRTQKSENLACLHIKRDIADCFLMTIKFGQIANCNCHGCSLVCNDEPRSNENRRPHEVLPTESGGAIV